MENLRVCFFKLVYGLLFLLIACHNSIPENTFSKENLIPWSIVGFDVKERTPEERIEMIQNLGYKQYGYGHRVRHIPSMAKEWKLAQEKGIEIHNVWLYINLDKDKPAFLRNQNEAVFKNLKETKLHTEIWVGMDPKYFTNISENESLESATEMIRYLSKRAQDLGCKIALYNHGGWYGDPENQLKIIHSIPDQEIGVVFNFHHAHDALEVYSQNIKKLLPYLWCVNLNGMKADGPKIMTIGKGSLEKKMIQELTHLGYTGPWGILGHVKSGDPEIILEENYQGLQQLFKN
ncbi:TIM barrel protein [Flavicella sp.]|uniref:sugar phosphate isomerase/epimerase family protein n=1 Tax=Flavicella sp. TaxID=2957742 RepID=UPI00261F372D|nr:TIM barrel protein [Flavicella sp.]MDG1805602.1 hypothetical protein [Flavicella sp.]MDG2279723.1 hypothetical protein [Flavicella sp.]